MLNWRLYLPESWAEDAHRRAEAGIPEDVKFQRKWELALEMIDQARGWKLADGLLWRMRAMERDGVREDGRSAN